MMGFKNLFDTTLFTITVLPYEDASFTLSPSCYDATATITGNTDGTFVLATAPLDIVAIDPNTGKITNGTPNTTYEVECTTNGPYPPP
ncbi:hypothetical protein OOZ15_07825 [Galbibacter sp. EGI 63066]|uniref:hypothetical protein n=1 Tax=Galbibacter sp. EGI 63066 TaxID=2993559 RepID=UPI002248E7CA|nr:hypothetical protein [Galbibacter sp. EGI 63066]MCX2679840.1 hypothetical protein [Galbibacter sp. EGI 63066]